MERNAQFRGLQRQQTKREQTQFPVGDMLLPDLLPSSYFPPQPSQAALSSGVQGCGCTAEGGPWYQSTVQRGGVTRAGVWDGAQVSWWGRRSSERWKGMRSTLSPGLLGLRMSSNLSTAIHTVASSKYRLCF